MKTFFEKLQQLGKMQTDEIWGGLVATLVALPSAIAFGVAIYAPLGSKNVAVGALAGVIGTVVLGLIVPFIGGTKRLITAPCAPAAALLSAFVINYVSVPSSATLAIIMLIIIGVLTGIFQIIFGIFRFGGFAQHIPYPVISGFLTGVGLFIIIGQVPKFLGITENISSYLATISFSLWHWQSVFIGLMTILAMIIAPRLTHKVPTAIFGIVTGMLVYLVLSIFNPELRSSTNNRFVIGPLFSDELGIVDSILLRWQYAGNISWAMVKPIIDNAFILAVLLSIDTIKTCVVLGVMTASRYNPNRELIGQGIGNIFSAILGGIPGAGVAGATIVNHSANAKTSVSGFLVGVFSLIAILVFGGLIQWVPISSLAAILIVVGIRMIDKKSLRWILQKDTRTDFFIALVVVVTALSSSLINATIVGVLLSAVLFLREQIHHSVVRHYSTGSKTFSRRIRSLDDMQILYKHGHLIVVIELEGSLFFGTANQLSLVLEKAIAKSEFLLLDFRRVQSMDLSAVRVFETIRKQFSQKGGQVIFSHLPTSMPNGRNLRQYFEQLGLLENKNDPSKFVRFFGERDEALEWIEDALLTKYRVDYEPERILELREMEIFNHRKEETLFNLEVLMEKLHFKKGEVIYTQGAHGDELYLIRSGTVRVSMNIHDKNIYHYTFGRGDFFGEASFFDNSTRLTEAVARENTEIFSLSRKDFESFADEHPRCASNLLEGLASVLARRLRFSNARLRSIEEIQ